MRNPLYDDLCKILGSYTVSFHTPGHKYKAMQDLALMRIDTTEIEGTDHLHYSTGILKEAQERARDAYKTLHSFFLVNGTTCGIHAMMRAAVPKGKKIVIQRDAHKSVYNACALFDIPLLILEPLYDQKLEIPKGIRLKDLKHVLDSDDSIGAVLLTSPNYYGLTLDIEAAAALCHDKDIPLLVDEAHGAHFAFSEHLPQSAVHRGADMVCQSTHKTLPAMTQAAVLHVCTSRVSIDKIMLQLEVLQTSSPSYVLMNSIDYAVHFATLHGPRLIKGLCDQLQKTRKNLSRKIGLKDLQQTFKRYNPDPLRWIIPSEPFHMSGHELEQTLRHHYGIQMELSSQNFVLAIISLLNSNAEIEALEEALVKIAMDAPKHIVESTPVALHSSKYTPVLSLSDAFNATGEELLLVLSEGRILRTAIVPYPPGVPLILPGERMTAARIEQVLKIISQKQVNGVAKECIVVVKDQV